MSLSVQSSSGPNLKLFTPESSLQTPPPEPAFCTLREFYLQFMAPRLKDRDGNAEQYEVALNHWERLTTNPPLSMVSDDTLADFQARAAAEPHPTKIGELWRNHATVNKIIRQLDAIFSYAGPRGPRRRGARGVISLVPYVEPLTEDETAVRIVPLDDLAAIYDACRVAVWPRGFGNSPIVWWRCLVALSYNIGMRTNDLLSRSWSDVRTGSRDIAGCSRPDVTYFTLVPKKTKRKKPSALYIPCNPTALAHLGALDRDRGMVFAKPRNTGLFYATWKAIQAAAGIAEPYELQDIRRTCNTALNRLRPGIGDWVLGHGKRKSVNAEYYTQIEEDLLEVLPLLKQPAPFLAGPTSSKQLRLF